MLCERCKGVSFEPLLAQDKKTGFYILHHSQESYSLSLTQRCALCTLISSQLGKIEVEDDVCNYLEAFMVLKRRWPSGSDIVTGTSSPPILVHSRLGFGTLSAIDALPSQYRTLDYEHSTSRPSRKRKRIQLNASESLENPILRHSRGREAPLSRELPPHHTGSHENMELAHLWIKDCLQNHDMCAIGSSHRHVNFVPTRLVDTQDPMRPFLLIVTDDKDIEYITLSYVWGQGERFRTTRATLKDHQDRIPLESVPKTFAHAFQVTRELGYRYIWIDALCIIQDDNGDLERELAVMGEIYRHATFTIFAEGARDVFAGLFQKRDPYLYQPCVININTATGKDVISEQVTLGTIITGPNYLKTRGWVLQEEILSTRSLSFGEQISWQCAVSEASETRPAPQPRKSALSQGRATCEDKLRLWLYAPAQMGCTPRENWFRWNHFDAWYSVMEEYSIKDLSFPTDQLRALSGLADLFRKAHHATYLAGLWREDLQLGLAWYVASNDSRIVSKAGDQKPSWSWASVGTVRLKYRSWAAFSQHIVTEGIEVLDASCTPADEANPCGSVTTGLLTLRARVKKLTLCWSAEYVENRTEFSYGDMGTVTMTRGEHPRFPALIIDSESNRFIGEAALDRQILTESYESGRSTETFGASSTESGVNHIQYKCQVWCALLHVQKTPDNVRHNTALILEQDKKDSTTHCRLGLLFFDDQRVKGLSYSDWNMETIRIV
ncbi:heterokaryon incompatibility protein-domain-containing protein [Xylaria bambusicola]|uniref:heterokaryon incompatibility protein-domain-containing protein n=1 Tax=Xylaria bambusicola TaxID=326684 RepID=UPI002008C57D|nr:heterokaryon incompatibility protein-domain-containing protein [Xylaria bambusicola]KAI0514751.1 heterokaryon incompatibility protein-domain-containing protein [Xylaria bambusicola]